MKPSVYIETSIIGYLTARPSNDIRAMANQNTTVEWRDGREVVVREPRHPEPKRHVA